MGFKQRGYDKEQKQTKTRDYSLFAIACEGTLTEPEYFRPFDQIDRIKVDILRREEGDRGSAPKKVLELAIKYIEEVGLSEKDRDSLWFVVDVDKWPRQQLEDLNEFCKDKPNWHVVISNPCFEIWLLYHKLKRLEDMDCTTAQKAKQKLRSLQNDGYKWKEYLPLLQDAIQNARESDTNTSHFYPNPKETKVYQLGEALISRIGIPRFNDFISNLRVKKELSKK